MRTRAFLRLLLLLVPAALAAGLSACRDRGDPPDFSPPTPSLRRLTQVQYGGALRDLFGDSLLIPSSLEPDSDAGGLFSVGASLSAISPRGVEQYEAAAYQVADQVLTDPAVLASLLPCAPAGAVDDGCASATLAALGRRAWRRPLSDEELATLVSLSRGGGKGRPRFTDGLRYGIAALLLSPNFLYRVELGEPDPENPGQRRLTAYELATRLSYFLWNRAPDDALLDAAAGAALDSPAGLAAEVDRLLASPLARQGVRNLFTEMLQLWKLDELNKDPLVFVHMSPEVGPSAREETLRVIERLVFDDDADFRDLLVTQETEVDRKLAAIYGVRAPTLDGFGPVRLSDDAGRRGFLGQISYLALQSHPAASSVTLRGKFIRQRLLCETIPPPPADVNTAIPEVSQSATTMRQRVAIHLRDPYCAGCHEFMDPPGLGLENFDGLGGWRDDEDGHPIDASGELDGEAFDDAWELAQVVRNHEELAPCVARTAYEYATGRVVTPGDEELVAWHAEGYDELDYRVLGMLRDVALGPAFRQVGDFDPLEEP